MEDFDKEEEEKEVMLTDEQIAEIKKTVDEIKGANPKIKKVLPIAVLGDGVDEKEIYVGYFKHPSFITFSKYMSLVQKDAVGATKELAKDCFIGGDKELLSEDSLFLFGLMPQLSALTKMREGKLVNLSSAGK